MIPAGPVAPLTGERVADLSLGERRALAVKVDNNGKARPQVGLTAADIVYELLIEGGSTRLLAVFHSEVPDRIGPVRSARSSDIGAIWDLSGPYLASSGANSIVLGELRRAHDAGTLVDVGGLRTSEPYERDPDRRGAVQPVLRIPETRDNRPGSAGHAPIRLRIVEPAGHRRRGWDHGDLPSAVRQHRHPRLGRGDPRLGADTARQLAHRRHRHRKRGGSHRPTWW